MTIVITGTSSGLGLELARLFTSAGHQVIGLSRSGRSDFDHPNLLSLAVDVANTAHVRHAAARVKVASVDLIIQNAGLPGSGRTLAEVDADEVRQLLDVNLFGALNVAQAFLSLLRQSRAGRIVHISSRFGSMTYNREPENRPLKISYSYRLSKAAQNMLAVCLANELEPAGIAVDVIHPGSFTGGCGRLEAEESPAQAATRIFNWITSGEREELAVHDTAGHIFGW